MFELRRIVRVPEFSCFLDAAKAAKWIRLIRLGPFCHLFPFLIPDSPTLVSAALPPARIAGRKNIVHLVEHPIDEDGEVAASLGDPGGLESNAAYPRTRSLLFRSSSTSCGVMW